ncbi:MAG: RHS repeat-associated core domain-containing protein [Myxococcota bacterium]|nr:RHS repeat-associated core domain-containing protein [Myxococcota bacterium]
MKPANSGSNKSRLLALTHIALAAVVVGTSCGQAVPPPLEGGFETTRAFDVDAFGVLVNTAGGNGRLHRTDWTIETRLGTYRLGAVYNSTSGSWHSSFEMTFDGTTFVDDSGAQHDVSPLLPGMAIPGTYWVYVGPASIKTKGGRLHEFGASGRLARTRWVSDAYPSIEYIESVVAGESRISSANECSTAGSCSTLFSAVRDPASGAVTSIIDRAGRTSAYSYDASGRLSSARDPLDTARGWPGFVYEYAGVSGRLSAFTSSEGERIEIDCDPVGRVAQVRRVGVATSHAYQFDYLGLGVNLTLLTDPEANVWLYEWDSQYRPVSLTTPSGDVQRWTWSEHRLTSHTRPDATSVLFAYGAGEDPQTVTEPSGNVVQLSYQPGGEDREFPHLPPLATMTDALGLVEQRTYDAEGRLETVQNGAGELMRYTYTSQNMIDSIRFPSGRIATLIYGAGNVQGIPRFVYLGLKEVYSASLDAVGNITRSSSTADPLSGGAPGIVRRSFDEDRNLATLTVEDLPTTGFVTEASIDLEWRSDHRRSAIRRPYGGDTEFDYDAFGNRVERRERVGGEWVRTTWEHDGMGRVLLEELANGMQRATRYRADGRPDARLFARDGVNETLTTASFVDGRLRSYFDGSYGGLPAETRTYDAAGRLATLTFPHGESIEFEYDVRSRPIRQIFRYDTGVVLRTLEYEYDLANRLLELREGGEMLIRNTFVDGELVEEEFRNGLRRELIYDAETGEPQYSLFRAPSGSVVAAMEVVRDLCNGLVPTIHCVTHLSSSPVGSWTEEYSLDSTLNIARPLAGQRLRTSSPAGSVQNPSAGFMSWYNYDLLGNRTRQSVFGESEVFVYDAEHSRLDRIVDDATGSDLVTYAYDAAGYMIDRAEEAITWDAKGQLTGIGARVQITWDGHYRAISSTVDGVTTGRRFGGIATASASGVLRTLELGSVSIDLATGSERYRHSDFRGNVKLVSDEAGNVITNYTYSGYGLFDVGGDDSDRLRFGHGLQLDDDLVLLGVRVYDQQSGRFLSPDPLYQVVNQYAYTTGNPISQFDLGGLHVSPITQTAAGAGVMGGTLAWAAPGTPAGSFGAGVAIVSAWVIWLDSVFGDHDHDEVDADGGACGCAADQAVSDGGSTPNSFSHRAPRGPGTDTGNAGVRLVMTVLTCGGAPTSVAQLPGLRGIVAGLMPINLLLAFWAWKRIRRRR